MGSLPLKSILLYFFGLFGLLISAQKVSETPPVFQHLETGLSQNSATQIFEDSSGFLWIGTPNGLNKYDGTEFQVFDKSVDGNIGLTDGYIESIYEDPDGVLYIGTNQGLNQYDRKFNTVKPFPFQAKGQFLQTKYIGAIARSHNWLWLGTDNSGVYRYDLKNGETQQIRFDEIYRNGPSNHYIVELFPLKQDKLMIVTQASIYVISNELQVISQITEPQDLSSAYKVSEDLYMLGSHDGKLIELKVQPDFELNAKQIPICPGHAILSIAQDNDGKIWLGSENSGLSIYNPKNGDITNIKADITTPNSISSNSIWSIHKAGNGVMWMGPFKKGLSFYDPEYYKFKHYKTNPFNSNSLNNNLVNSFLEDDKGNLWIGTDGGGLNYWNRKQNSFESFSLANGKLNTDVVLSLLRDEENKLWVGSWAHGLAILDLETMDFQAWNKSNSFLGSNNVTDMLQDKKGRIWIVTLFGGVHVYFPKSKTYQHISVRSEKDGSETITIARLFEDRNGQIWVGSQTSGLFRLQEYENKWVPVHYYALHAKRSINNDFINTMAEDKNGNFWVGTQGGLNKYIRQSDSFISITKKDGLPNDAIKGIVPDDEGYLWLSTGKGVVRYLPETNEIVKYDVNDGLQGNEFNAASYYKTSSGELLFGGSNGFNIFKPEEVLKRQDIPEVFISNLRIFNKSVSPNDTFGVLEKDISQTDTLVLAYNQDVVDFEFHALTYRHPERVQFAYYLEGFETEWNYVGSNQHATYTSLNPGKYTLRIKSTNSDGVWVNNETKLALQITPPYWKTWWFKMLITVLGVSTVFLIYQLRIRRLKRNQVKLEKEIDQRTKELQQKHKKLMAAADQLSLKNEEIQRFAFSVSHDLKSPLNSIQGIASLIPMELDMQKHPEMQEYVTYIDETCDVMNNLITDITKIAKLGKIENKFELLNTNEILEIARSLTQGRMADSNTKLHIEKNLPNILGDRNRMIQVFENLLDNAIKYMGNQKSPAIRIEAEKHGDEDRFRVIDNGSGLDENELNKLFVPFERFDGSVEGSGLGLYMVKKIIEAHHGTITAKSEGKGRGTTFIIALPHNQKTSSREEKGVSHF
ncbi:two-component regulator propeller domain-containing protein [Flagellimonas sp.]|uniref:two-component regulator propeller domain-containing protein n=1 Tax=Flagellimonas sp. TaxID=2058762 RepID=UPI003F49F5D4